MGPAARSWCSRRCQRANGPRPPAPRPRRPGDGAGLQRPASASATEDIGGATVRSVGPCARPHLALHGPPEPTTLPFGAGGPRDGTSLTRSRRMNYDPSNPLIVQGDRSVLVEVDNPRYAEARDALAPFAELEKSPEHIHTYRLTPLSLWNAAAAGLSAAAMLDALGRYSKFPLPSNLATDITELVSRYGRVKLERAGGANGDGLTRLQLVCRDVPLLEELARQPRVRDYLGERLDAHTFLIDPAFRGVLKQALIAVGYPAEDLAGYTEGAALPLHLRPLARSGLPFHVRDYQ